MVSTLVLLAAGMSTRYGRLKQLEPVGPGGEALLDYSVFDARKAGFSRVLLVIRQELEEAFREHIRGRWPHDLEVVFHHQVLGELPARLLSRRRKPWGTGHAILTARSLLTGPFAVVNADDFYGGVAFERAAGVLEGRIAEAGEDRTPTVLAGRVAGGEGETPVFALMTYTLEDTLSRHGGVSRGICRVDGEGWLVGVEEVLEIRRGPGGIRGRMIAGEEVELLGREPTSTNFWLFTPEVFPLLEAGFGRFVETLAEGLPGEGRVGEGADPGPAPEPEFLLPLEMNRILAAGQARIRAVQGGELFFGITHPPDRGWVMEGLQALVAEGRYPERLWEVS